MGSRWLYCFASTRLARVRVRNGIGMVPSLDEGLVAMRRSNGLWPGPGGRISTPV